MYQKDKKACVFGGTGFVGRQVVRELARQGFIIKVATRVPEAAFFLKPYGNVGQVVPFACDYSEEAVRSAVRGCDVVVNCVGILFEKGKKATFERVHADLPALIGSASAAENVGRLIHISALGCDKASSKYGKSKLAGEEALRRVYPSATILRPSVVFGPEDEFFNMFARLSVVMPFLPLIGGGKTLFQPVYVGDVALAVMQALNHESTQGRTYELGGPQTLSFKEIYGVLSRETARKPLLVTLPWAVAKVQGCLLSVLPKPPLTADQVESLKSDNVVSNGTLGFAELGIVPTGMDAILPTYLSRYRPGGRFGDKKRA